MSSIMSVSQLNRYIAFKLKEDIKLHGVLIRGEISNFTNHAKTGHFYFTLKDKDGAIKAVMFNNMASRLQFMPYNGMNIIVSANVQVFERDGIYQLYVNDIQPDGIGALYLAYEQLKEKLMNEGLFDEDLKKSLPAFPMRIGIVTSIDAAALQDMLNILSRRYPVAEVIIYPCLVQGPNAPRSICDALTLADSDNLDVIIVGRGGGSLEDLMAFNNESVARCIFSCCTPIISAVGHETDTSVSDFVADLRAPTPSAAAEIVAPDINMLFGYLNALENKLNNAYLNVITKQKHNLLLMENQLNVLLPSNKIKNYSTSLHNKEVRLNLAIKNKLTNYSNLLLEKAALLESLSPLKVLSRGYSLVYKDNILIKSSNYLNSNDIIKVKLNDGEFSAVVK